MEVASKLKVLLVYANPDADKVPANSRYPHLKDVSRHFDALRAALDPLVHAGELFIEVLRNPTSEQLRTTLTRFNPHVLVFAGHGYGHRNGGVVCVKDGVSEEWAFPELVEAVKNTSEPALRLAVFIACQSFAAAVMQDATPLLERIEREPDDIVNRMLTLLARALGRAAQADIEVVRRTCSRLIKAWQSQVIHPGTLDEAALIGLGRAKTPRHAVLLLDALRAALDDADEYVRRAAATALGKIGDATAVAALRAALHDAEQSVRGAAAAALRAISERKDLRIFPNGRVERLE